MATKQRKSIQEMAESMTATAVADVQADLASVVVADLPPSMEDWEAQVEAELGPATSDGPMGAGPHVGQNWTPPADTGPNPDLTPLPVSPDPWWEVSCPEFGLPRRDVQAPTAEVAEILYKQAFNVRRPKPTVRRLTDGVQPSVPSGTGGDTGRAE